MLSSPMSIYPGADPQTRRHRRDGQSQLPQAARDTRSDRGRSAVAQTAALFAGLQSDRTALCQTQSRTTKGRRAIRGEPDGIGQFALFFRQTNAPTTSEIPDTLRIKWKKLSQRFMLRDASSAMLFAPLPPRAVARGGEGLGMGGSAAFTVLADRPPPPTSRASFARLGPHRFAEGGEKETRSNRRCRRTAAVPASGARRTHPSERPLRAPCRGA